MKLLQDVLLVISTPCQIPDYVKKIDDLEYQLNLTANQKIANKVLFTVEDIQRSTLTYNKHCNNRYLAITNLRSMSAHQKHLTQRDRKNKLSAHNK